MLDKLPSFSTGNKSEDGTGYGSEVLGEVVVSLSAIHKPTNGACMEMDTALTVDFCKKISLLDTRAMSLATWIIIV